MKKQAMRAMVLAVLMLLGVCATVALAALCISDPLRMQLADFLVEATFGIRVIGLVVCLLIACLYVAFCILPFTGKSAPDLKLKNDEEGTVSITASALEKLAEAAAKGIAGVKDVHVSVTTKGDSIAYDITATVLQSAVIPEVIGKMRERVAQYVSDRVGMQVKSVDVNVTSCVPDESQTAIVSKRVK